MSKPASMKTYMCTEIPHITLWQTQEEYWDITENKLRNTCHVPTLLDLVNAFHSKLLDDPEVTGEWNW